MGTCDVFVSSIDDHITNKRGAKFLRRIWSSMDIIVVSNFPNNFTYFIGLLHKTQTRAIATANSSRKQQSKSQASKWDTKNRLHKRSSSKEGDAKNQILQNANIKRAISSKRRIYLAHLSSGCDVCRVLFWCAVKFFSFYIFL